MAFYYEFVSTNEATLERTDPKYFWEHVIAPRFDTYLGRVFERIAEQAYQWLQPRLRLPVVDRVSSPQARSNSGAHPPEWICWPCGLVVVCLQIRDPCREPCAGHIADEEHGTRTL
jgi:hypothetical protein